MTSRLRPHGAARTSALAILAQGWVAMLVAAPSHAAEVAMPNCANVGAPRTVLDKQGTLESLAFDPSGRLLFTNVSKKALQRLDRPGGAPVTVAQGLTGPGGIVVQNAHEAYVGTGNSVNGLIPLLGEAGIARVDLDTGAVSAYAKGLSMANGLVRTQEGTFYASDNLAASLDRITEGGRVQRAWMKLSGNGLVLSKDEKTLYVSQFLPAGIVAVDLANGNVRKVVTIPSSRQMAGLDGMDMDDAGRLYVPAYLYGEVWRVSRDGQLCLLAKGLSLPSAVAVGQSGQGYAATSVYVTTHSGRVHELPNAVPIGH